MTVNVETFLRGMFFLQERICEITVPTKMAAGLLAAVSMAVRQNMSVCHLQIRG